MRILAVSHEYPPIGGGGANAAYHLLHGFANRGHEISLVTTAYAGRSGSDDNRLKIYEVDSARKSPDSCSFAEMLDFMLKAMKCADRLVREAKSAGEPYDRCLIFFGIPSGPVGYRLKKKYGLPYFIRFGGGDIPGYQKRFDKVYKIIAPAIRVIWRDADMRIANSEGLRQMAYGFCDIYPFEVITNGVDTDTYCPLKVGDTVKDAVNILFVSRLIERKGLQHIIPELNRIIQSSDRDVKLTVVGDGPYREHLEGLAEKYGVVDHVDFVGSKKGDELISYYRGGDIFILPSSNEGMPNVVLEAMACGLPIIMTPCQGSAELVRDNGFISDTSGFADRIAELTRDSVKREKMGALSRQMVEEQFSWDSIIEKYLSVLEH